MPNFETCKLKIDFEFGSARNKFMTARAEHDGQVINIEPNGTGPKKSSSLELDITLPTKIVLSFQGKVPGEDTVIDAQGNILEDVYVQIVGVSLDGFKTNEKFLYQKMFLETDDGQSIMTNYAGFDGRIILNLDKQDVFAQYLWMNQ